jgi:hypothetical protein
LAVRLHQGYWVEVVRLEGAYFALVDLEKQALTKATLAELGNEALQHLRALQETPPLKALDPTKRKDVPGHPGWPKALKVEVVQGDLPLEEAVAQVYWLTKVEGGLHHPNVLPLSVAEPTGAPGDPD